MASFLRLASSSSSSSLFFYFSRNNFFSSSFTRCIVNTNNFYYSFSHNSSPGKFLSISSSLPCRNPARIHFDSGSISGFLSMASSSSSFSTYCPNMKRIPLPNASASKDELLRGLESAIGSSFSSEPLAPSANPLIIVISGPSGVGKDAVIKRLQEVRSDIHFVVTATSRLKRPGEVEGKDYYFVTKEQFLAMISKNELLEYALVYEEYKGIPKQQIQDFMSKGFDIVLRVDVQGAATLRDILRDSAVFVFLAPESELALVNRLVDRKTETTEKLLVRIANARKEVRHMKDFDYIVVNENGKLETAVKLVESIIDAEKAKVRQRRPNI